jgi:hypothetical protein
MASWLFLSASTLPGISSRPSAWVAVVTAPGLGAFLVVVEGDSAARLWTGWPFTVEGGLLGTGALVVGLLLIAAWVRLRRGSVRLDPSLVEPPIQGRAPAGESQAQIGAS